MSQTQDTRSARLTTPLGGDVLVFRSMTAYERISQAFEFRIVALTEEALDRPADLLGQVCAVAYHGNDGPIRHFHGTCAQVTFVGTDTGGGFLYQLILRPDFWFLSRNRDYRVFQDLSVEEIISEVLSRNGVTKKDLNLEADYPKREYCVQYGESDFAFLSRLMEEEGIFYFFKHEANGHKLVIADRSSVHDTVPDYDTVPYFPPGNTESRERDHLDEWSLQHNVVTAKTKFTGFHLDVPTPFEHVATGGGEGGSDNVEILNHIDNHIAEHPKMMTLSQHLADVRLDAERALRVVATASGDAIGLGAGAKFTLSEHPIDADNAAYVIVEARHRISSNAYHSGGGVHGDDRIDILAIPAATTFRKMQETPRPRIVGSQTALVTGSAGEEIETDKYGRVRVLFHWDTHDRGRRPSSCWVRVAQIMAGKQWGAVFTPRIGQEVLVDFIGGDPDRPIITGVVYNAEQMPPYELPTEKTKSTMKTDSSKGSGGFNELRFEDKKGKEELYMHAQKDMNIMVLNNLDTQVKNDETRTVSNNRTTVIDKGDEKLTLKMGNREEVIEMGNDSLKLKLGNQTTKLDLGKQETEAMQSIEFKVGQSSIKIDQTGVTIKGMMIKIDGTIFTEVKGLMTKVEASAILIAKGGLVMIN
ncbi:Actin cross-linking toxin VgrG1 [Alphaproteobacteria bacterium SO-S41]|nr:Actin cross-linking toxin VgrG1 [Alphaproteobacteria bacterium SO-S41]